MAKIRIGIIYGGRSGEHDVSLLSARSVMQALDKRKYDIVPISVSRQGEWRVAEIAGQLNGSIPPLQIADSAENGDKRSKALLPSGSESNQVAFEQLDVVFPVLHGTYGEDGTVQGMLELANVPYVGAGVVGSAVGMDKAVFKQVMVACGLPILPWKLVLRSHWQDDQDGVLSELESNMLYPMFTKPANLGSSVGITKCNNRSELVDGLSVAARFDRRIVVEQGVTARELEVAVLGNDRPEASVVGEIRPKQEFYSYEAKYISDDSELIIPAEISAEMSDSIRQIAIDAYRAIDCAGLGRVDFLLDTATEKIYINEINTIPGFTSISMYAKLWEASGLRYADLLDKLVGHALDRFEEKSQNQTVFNVT